jgi:hypothetical protein
MTTLNSPEDFLSGREFKDLVRKVARDLERDLCSRSGLVSPLEGDQFGTSTYDREHRITAIEGEIYAYLCKHRDRILKAAVVGHEGDDILWHERTAHYLKRKVSWKLQDVARTADRNPYGYFRKRSGDVFRAHFHVATDHNRLTIFSLYPENEASGSIPEEDLRQFASPLERVEGLSPTTATQRDHLLALGRLFWEEASKRKGGRRVWVNLTDFVRWADQHLHLRPARVAGIDEAPEQAADQPNAISWVLDREKIRLWANCFLGQMEKAEKGFFHYIVCLKSRLEEAAAKLGYQSASGLDYPRKKLERKLRFFLRDKDWLSPEDLDRDARDFFTSVLCADLKNAFLEP